MRGPLRSPYPARPSSPGVAWDLVDGFGTAGTLLFMAALVPQAVRTHRLGHAEDISAAFLVTVLAGSLSMLLWSASLGQWVVASGFVANLLVWGYVLKVRLRPREAAARPHAPPERS